MTPLRHLRPAWSQLRRRGRGLLLPALLCCAVLLLLLQDRPPQQQQWRARQPAAIRRNTSGDTAGPDPGPDRIGEAAGPDPVPGRIGDAVWAGRAGVNRPTRTERERAEPALTENRSGENSATAVKRSYVSGHRFVNFDPTEVEANVKVKSPLPSPQKEEIQKHAKSSSVAGHVLSNDVLRPPGQRGLTKGNTAGPRAGNTRPRPNLTAGAHLRGKLSAHHDTAASGSTSNADSVTNTGKEHDTAAASGENSAPTSDSPAYSDQDSGAASGQDSAAASVAPSEELPVSDAAEEALPASGAASDALPASDAVAQYRLPGCACSRLYSPAAYRALNGTRSSCGLTADLRGARQNVISFSFYGNASSVFFGGIAANLARVPEVYPGWVVRVYHDIDLKIPQQQQLVCEMQCRYDNVDFCDVRELPGLGDISKKFGMIWRFMPLADDTVERFIVRDLDSLIGSRERAAVDDWIASNRTFHAMRDAPAHGTEILGGMWGGWNRYNDLYRRVRDRIIKVTQWKFKGLDQRVLTVVLWPLIVKHRDLVAHDSYLCFYYPMSRPFPTQRESPFDFVGSPSLIDSGFRLQSHCPYFCRPRQHRDWQWC